MRSTLFAEIKILLFLLATMALIAFLFRRFPLQGWFEQRLPRLFPASMARSLESIARERPFNFFGMMFFGTLGAMAFVGDVQDVSYAPFFRYSMAGLVAAFMLYTSRHNAAARPT